MYKSLVVVDTLDGLPQIDANIIDFAQYLADYPKAGEPKTRVINLCNTSLYLSEGYYCSLLAEARQHKVLPSVNCINDLTALNRHESVEKSGLTLAKSFLPMQFDKEEVEILVFFGWTENESFKKLSKHVFERYPAPILRLKIKPSDNSIWVQVSVMGCNELDAKTWPVFIQRLEHYTQSTWRNHYNKKKFRWDMAILVNEQEKTPPSDSKALKSFIKAAEQVGIHAELINAKQATNIGQYDALFIRETTAIDHHTYRLARKAEQDGLVVIDDAQSILRCCNKVFLHDAFSYNKVPAPKSSFVSNALDETCEKLAAEFGYPIVLKLPESSFSMGVFKVENFAELKLKLTEMLTKSALVLVQEYVYTDFDWRIGVLNGRAIYACRYFMARNHWQIYNHGSKAHFSGDFETLPTFEVPKPVLDAAVKASAIVGKGLYGVDIKQVNNQVYVIEVNDNPSLESKVEDLYLGKELYMIIMQEFANRLEARGR
ncbi:MULTISPECIES: RimK family protein [Alteromonadaceae]|uniref:RimK family protein n=1 Tax=Alteromonadaceae TaxID=72275 RepID=UPI001C087B6E|nr:MULTISPECIES: RimK family protein [Aliiglaciecola]MBU2878451.1 RimK family protein [Aliiglaciecola lipolytica]MDO6712921.1 RimK family protein [Aliiglaciecola sp. 2_MG-2023]MDO6753960.1 RimK family protein [Aliiglaciecola sp. 1_MG-2023]